MTERRPEPPWHMGATEASSSMPSGEHRNPGTVARIEALSRAAQQRSAATAGRIEAAVDQLRADRERVTPTAIQRITGCSRTTINLNDKARSAIALDKDLPGGPVVPPAARSSDDSWRSRALNAEDASRRLRQELKDARASIAELVQQLRDARARPGPKRTSAAAQGECSHCAMADRPAEGDE
jgi:hypothetical protein